MQRSVEDELTHRLRAAVHTSMQLTPEEKAVLLRGPDLNPRPVLCAEEASLTTQTSLAILIPFREDFSGRRTAQLLRLLTHLQSRFLPELPGNYGATVVVLEQSPEGAFNKGKLLNVGARWCRTFLGPPVLLVLQDVDLLPEANAIPFYCHHRAGDCVHPGWIDRKYDYDHFFGGVCTMTLPDYVMSGGMPNDFWGWGKEDDCLFWRLKLKAGCRILTPREGSMTLLHQDEKKFWTGGPGVPHNPLELNPERQIGAEDTIWHSSDFQVVSLVETYGLTGMIIDLRPPATASASNAAGRKKSTIEFYCRAWCRTCAYEDLFEIVN